MSGWSHRELKGNRNKAKVSSGMCRALCSHNTYLPLEPARTPLGDLSAYTKMSKMPWLSKTLLKIPSSELFCCKAMSFWEVHTRLLSFQVSCGLQHFRDQRSGIDNFLTRNQPEVIPKLVSLSQQQIKPRKNCALCTPGYALSVTSHQ